ncbi:hypothetical protein LOY86_006541 [Ophidiomyces ophidiicola]|nr:hypothetical protein LOZ28_005051 [Ophidiomyces ophidiicola]KAI2448289.1 hypothetical protein LOY86_006541 [Ophidiomyces ophidiicola]
MELPRLAVPLGEFVPHLGGQNRRNILDGDCLAPYKAYESKLREVFAQDPGNEALLDPHVNVVPIYAGDQEHLKVKARNLEQESTEESEKYLLPLTSTFRREEGSFAVVPSLNEFKDNFRLFSESSLVDLDWSNVVVAGSAVTTCLLPLSEEHKSSRKAQREFYHEKIAPASDVDLFIYGLNEEQAIEKIKRIEKCIRDSILEETTVIRTKNALTIASKYPTRHVQIVLRLYKSVSEILTGFDVDCSCTAFDGSQVWASPRALASFVTQANTIDLTRRSPSYENRLAKYSHRGFEVYWPHLNRSKVDPTIYERAFSHVVGLARILVMEKLPTAGARDSYVEQRRSERDRPPSTKEKFYRNPQGNLKEYQPEDVAEWVEEEDVSNYHTFTIPYGPKYTAKKIEKLLYKKDLLLNAEWNKSKERTVNLHRHPAFFGAVEHVIEDCCGFCPKPVTEEEIEVAEEESKRFISGKVQFMKDDPGRQAIGSFNPITDSDWTEMAYIGDTARLCQAIVDNDVEVVKACCAQEGFNVDQRDHTGRMPLHLAIMCSTPEVVQCLIDNGARLIARVAGGYTSLHLAAARGNGEILKAILRKSEANKAEHAEKNEKKPATPAAGESDKDNEDADEDEDENEDEDEDDDISVVQSVSDEAYAATQGSMVVIKKSTPEYENPPEEAEGEEDDEPNFYDNVDVLSWDTPISALHLALLNGHSDIVHILATEFGANVAQPIVWRKPAYYSKQHVTLSMALATHHPLDDSKRMLRTLLELGASSTQADMNHITAFHSIVMEGETELIDTLFELDGPAAQLAINHPAVGAGYSANASLPLSSAARSRGSPMIKKLLEHGASLSASSERLRRFWARREKNNSTPLENQLAPPIVVAAQFGSPAVIKILLDAGSDVNALSPDSHALLTSKYSNSDNGQTILDIINSRLEFLRDPERDNNLRGEPITPEPPALEPDEVYLQGLKEGSYEHRFVLTELDMAKHAVEMMKKKRERGLENNAEKYKNDDAKAKWIKAELEALEIIKETLIQKDAKTFQELHPDFKGKSRHRNHSRRGDSEEPDTESDKKFSITCSFRDYELGPVDNPGYMELFEAAWDGDIEKLKRLTLGSGSSDQKEALLRVSVCDKRGVDPFVIALARGHLELAKTVLEIVEAQYVPKTEAPVHKQYEVVIDSELESEYSDSESESETEDNHGVGVRFNVVDEQHTIDDVRELGNIVKSSTPPRQLVVGYCNPSIFVAPSVKDLAPGYGRALSSYTYGKKRITSVVCICERILSFFMKLFCRLMFVQGFLDDVCTEWRKGTMDLISFAVEMNDLAILDFIIDQTLKYRKPEDKEEEPAFLSVGYAPFKLAMERGYTEILGHLIAKTGVQFPFKSLMKKAGIKSDSKPDYYQGLTVYGRKREDWAAENGHGTYSSSEVEESLLLHAAFSANVESIKWALTDAPDQMYKQFASTYADDKRLMSFSNVPGGFEGVLSSWLNTRRELALHCAVLSNAKKEQSSAHVELLIDKIPDSLNAKNKDGYTPLHVAIIKRKIIAAKAIVKAGADQMARDIAGRNLLHFILCPSGKNTILKSTSLFGVLSAILDKEVLQLLAAQRSHVNKQKDQRDSWGMQTPLAEWLTGADNSQAEMLQVMLQATGGKELYILDGEGNYPIHQAVRRRCTRLVRVMLDMDPSLALLENATGATPLELSENKYFSAVLASLKQGSSKICEVERSELWDGTPCVYSSIYRNWYYHTTEPKFSEPFKGEDEDRPRFLSNNRQDGRMYRMLQDIIVNNPLKRKLVSLQDANQLVKRLAGRKWRRVGEERGENKVEQDEVSKHLLGSSSEENWEVEEIIKQDKKEAMTPDEIDTEGSDGSEAEYDSDY